MRGLERPPKEERPVRLLGRLLGLVILVCVAGVAIWTAVTNQRIDLIETVDAETLELDDFTDVDGYTVYVREEVGGPIPVILLHDADVAGSVLFDAVAAEIGGRYKAVRVDLPGFGLSDRLPTEGPRHTVASMAEIIGSVVKERYELPVVLVGVGLGGRVAAEMAVIEPDLVRGVVLVDVDFWAEQSWGEFGEKLPLVGRAITFTLETGGLLSSDAWAPNCDTGGWCPSAEQSAARAFAAAIEGSTDSIRSFLRTLPSSLVPSDLGLIEAPVAFIRSTAGEVPPESVDRILQRLPEMSVIESSAWKAHLETPADVAAAVSEVAG